LWSVPFQLKTEYEIITLFLMDIYQGKDITEEEYTSLMGLASLISSQVIENPFEDKPTSFNEFVETIQSCETNIIALRPREETLNDVPLRTIFQICFWTSKDKELLESISGYYKHLKQEIKVIPVAAKTQDELLDELDFLMGEDVVQIVQNVRFRGILILGVIYRKKIFERSLFESDFFNFCKAYVSLFQDSAEISPENIEKKFAEVFLRILVSVGVLEYEDYMAIQAHCMKPKEPIVSYRSLIQHHLKAEEEVKRSFEWNLAHSSLIVQSQEMKVYERELNFLMCEELLKAQSSNEIKRNKWVEDLRSQSIEKFQNPSAPRFFNDEAFHDETQLRQICSREITSQLTYFKEKVVKYFFDEDLTKEIQKTKDLLQQELKVVLDENKRRKEAADERRAKELFDRNVQKLADKIGIRMALEFVTQKLLEPVEDQAKEQTLNQVT